MMVILPMPVTWKADRSELSPYWTMRSTTSVDVASIIEGPIYIVDRDGSRETLGAQILDLT